MSLGIHLDCFKAYDVRGKLGSELDENIVYRIGRATTELLRAKSVIVGYDARRTSPKLADAVSKGVCDSGSDIFAIGLAGTEEMYSAVSVLNADAGIAITASHNPIEYNGMKIIKRGSQPLSENELIDIKQLAEKNEFVINKEMGSIFDRKELARISYLERIISFVDQKSLKPLRILVNSGNGPAGIIIDELDKIFQKNGIDTCFLRLNHNVDPSFPNGVPNPLLKKNHSIMQQAIKNERADFGVAFDGDFDRCFLFDHLGKFISGEYVIGLLVKIFLNDHLNCSIIHDPKVIWNIQDMVANHKGRSVVSKPGHPNFKSSMRKTDSIYGGEVSGHHYFRDFFYCDSGMIPWLLIWQLLSQKNITLFDLVCERQQLFPSSGEINFKVRSPSSCLQLIRDLYIEHAQSYNEVDGLSINFENWRFNLRISKTEVLVRLNVETKGDQILLKEKTRELKNIITKT